MLTIPYLVSSIGCLELERTALGRRSGWGSMGIAALVSVVTVILQNQKLYFTGPDRWLWYAVLLGLLVIEMIEIRQIIQRTRVIRGGLYGTEN